ncbi:MAG: hypothetical protein ACRC0V_05030, partial [Fusobacteriaceae bacterium]
MNHRKNINLELEKQGYSIKPSEIKNILKNCETCIRKDKNYIKTCDFVYTNTPGELFAVDILEISKNERVVLGIDYFTRKLFGKYIKTKEASKIKEFLDCTYKTFPFKKLLTDCGCEFDNNLIKEWTAANQVEHVLNIPYYHQGNGRVERANRTIREAIKKTAGSLKIKLQGIIDNYNNSFHRAMGMTPDLALDIKNHAKV